ncbi:hypothetical protein [Streptomyces collinus]|uniref:hypothetical protein n=1 Tax=Streptomyces collinus TaxID=42684 RepID=UPI00344315CE
MEPKLDCAPPAQTRDHLAELAEGRGLSAEQVAAARAHARKVIGVDVSDEEFATLDVLGNLRRIAAEKVLAMPGKDTA